MSLAVITWAIVNSLSILGWMPARAADRPQENGVMCFVATLAVVTFSNLKAESEQDQSHTESRIAQLRWADRRHLILSRGCRETDGQPGKRLGKKPQLRRCSKPEGFCCLCLRAFYVCPSKHLNNFLRYNVCLCFCAQDNRSATEEKPVQRSKVNTHQTASLHTHLPLDSEERIKKSSLHSC